MLETLDEEPSVGVLLQVATELARRRRWADAATQISAFPAMPPEDTDEGAELATILAECLYEEGRYADALEVLGRLEVRPAQHLRNARVHVLCLAAASQHGLAYEAAGAYLKVDPSDVAISAALDRVAAPVPQGGLHGADPFFTVERAERYAMAGRVDKAIRVYRRILLSHPDEKGLVGRLRALALDAMKVIEDDLSEELMDPSEMPLEPLDMPEPQIINTPLVAVPRVVVAGDPEAAPIQDEVTEMMPRGTTTS